MQQSSSSEAKSHLANKEIPLLTFWRRNHFLILAHPVYKM